MLNYGIGEHNVEGAIRELRHGARIPYYRAKVGQAYRLASYVDEGDLYDAWISVPHIAPEALGASNVKDSNRLGQVRYKGSKCGKTLPS